MKLLHEHKYSEHKEILNTSKVSVIHARTYTKKILFFFPYFSSFLRLDWVVISLEVLGRSSGTRSPPITPRVYFDSP